MSKMLKQQYPILSHIDSCFKPLLMSVLVTNKLETHGESIKIDSVSSSCGKVEGDRFILSIPYARQNLIWYVFFDSQCPEMGPDFIFNDNTFLSDMDVDTLIDKVPSLVKWNPYDKNALLNVIVELLACYKQHQVQLFQKHHRLQIEYDMLIRSTDVELKDVQMILLPFGSKPTEARFVIKFLLDVSGLSSSSPKPEYETTLVVTYSETDWSRNIPELCFPKSLENIFNDPPVLNLTFFPNKLLLDYILEVKECVTKKMELISDSLEKRRQFMTAWLIRHYGSVLEYDTDQNNYITCLIVDNDDFYFVLKIELPTKFPDKKPIVTLTSIYHMERPDVLYSEVINGFSYNKNMNPSTMVKKITQFVAQHIKNFKTNSLTKCAN